MTAAAPKRLLEELLPLVEIGVESSKSVSYGDLHAIHTWSNPCIVGPCRPTARVWRDGFLGAVGELQSDRFPEQRRQRSRSLFGGSADRIADPDLLSSGAIDRIADDVLAQLS